MARKILTPRTVGLSTRAIHGMKLHPFKAPVAPPIVQTSTYRFESSEDAVRYAKGDPEVLVYTRYHNPTVWEAEERLALIMNAEKALFVASGMAAISSAILAAAKTGDEIISTPALYGGTYRFFRDILPDHGITVRYVEPDRLKALSEMISKKTTIVYFETPTNPTIGIVDIKRLVAATREGEKRSGAKVTIIADNTFATAINQDPFVFGVDVLVESATKYLGGHTDLMGGVVAGKEAFVREAHTRMKYYGGCADPFAAYLLVRSLKTFELRVRRQNENALLLAQFLQRQKNVVRVLYPGLRSHPQHAIARRQMTGGYGGMLTIEVRGGVAGAVAVCDALNVAVNAMSLGGVETLVSIPVYSSHVNMSAEELARHGVAPGMIRVSTGIEDIEDLKADFEQALQKVPG
ncbi:MAG TPA: PLP-dependent aspartate aminotransferase family protein [Bacteroidota bacterium]|nr:PLP-dependent aspartate aminotransferase family protein [Bacteroidota bacterium]